MKAAVDPRWSHGAGLLALVAAVWWSWQTQALPTLEQIHRMRTRLASLRQHVEQTEQQLARAGGEAAWMSQQFHHLRAMRQRIPPSRHVPQLLDRVLAHVEDAHAHLVNVSRGNLEPAHGADGHPILLMVDGAPCLRLPVVLTMEGRFAAILAYLERLTSPDFSCLVHVEAVDLTLADPVSARLNASIQFTLYVTGS